MGCSRIVFLLAAQPTAGTPSGGAHGGTEGGAAGGAASVAPDGAASGREAVKLERQMEALSMEVGKYIKHPICSRVALLLGKNHCCGSGLFYPRYGIRNGFFSGSRIPNPYS